MYRRSDRVVRFFTVDISYLVRFGTDPDLFHGGIPDVVHSGFPTADSDVGSFSRGRTGDPNLRRRRRAEEIRLVAQRNRDAAGSIRSRPRIRRFILLLLNAIPDGMRIHEIEAIAADADGPAVRIQTGRSEIDSIRRRPKKEGQSVIRIRPGRKERSDG